MKTILVLEGGFGADAALCTVKTTPLVVDLAAPPVRFTGQTCPADISTETHITEYDEKENVWFVIGGDRVRHDFDDAEMALAFVQQTLREQQEADT